MVPFYVLSENGTFFGRKMAKNRIIYYVSILYENMSENGTFLIPCPKMVPFRPKMVPLTFLNFCKVLSISRLASRARLRLL